MVSFTRKRMVLFVVLLSLVSGLVHLAITCNNRLRLPWEVETPIYAKRPRPLWRFYQWEPVRSLEPLRPYANPRGSYPVPREKNNGFIYAKIFGGFAKIRSSICDLVAISRLLNATLVIPEIQESTRSKHISHKFKSFSYLYNEDEFIASLSKDVIIVKSLPEDLKAARKRNEIPTFKPKGFASPNFYMKEVLPELKKVKAIGLVITDGGCLQSMLPPSMSEFQRLRCRVAFHALQFRPEIQKLGRLIIKKHREMHKPFIAYHPGLTRETLAYHGCAELFQDVHTELIQYRRAQMIKQGIVNDELSVDSHFRRDNGSCPLLPEEVGLLLRAMGYDPQTNIYIAGAETFGGQRVLIPLLAMFENARDRTFHANTELPDLVGPETRIPSNNFQPSPVKSEKQLKEEWNRAGPRPRPLPPPPARPIYQHEKEGWYGWITETDTEPDPSPMDLRQQAHRLLWDALDYIVSVEADAFFPGFHNDGSGWPDFSNLVMGHRLYEGAASRTYRPDRKVLQEFFNMIRDDLYHPKHNWTRKVKEHLWKSMAEEGLIRESLLSKPTSFLSHPVPECSCRVPSEDSHQVKGDDGRFLYGGEIDCPEWMPRKPETFTIWQTVELAKLENNGSADYESPVVEQPESDDTGDKSSTTSAFDQDDEWDPND
ncbi:protein EMBRYO SAC DEVELOPMENT ARREST 30-like [Tripterygium wilfordii]|uniref:protein EMBRYO SAC DEVELOPMENT ARREST 30-like n=1 Tax=Tripterygium wilfordii TaxID=458696 RepID=UPI0018F81C0D|nr:protein EMBRYO SAC DEVELOPMENT ARREST 30-like [Tripterygium wilfordii]